MCPRMERIDVLRDDTLDQTQVVQMFYSKVSGVRFGFGQRGPAHETSCPVSLPCLVILQKLVVIRRTERLVDAVSTFRASIIRKAAGDGNASSSQNSSRWASS